MNTLLKKYVKQNHRFFSKRKKRDSKEPLLIDLQSNNLYVVSVLMKIAAAVSELHHLEIMVIPALKTDGQLKTLIKSFLPKKIVRLKYRLIIEFLTNCRHILTAALFDMKSGEHLIEFKTENCQIGVHIYDSLLRRMGLSNIDKLSFKQKMWIIYELSFFYVIYNLIRKEKIKFAILPDNAYRGGIRLRNIKYFAYPKYFGDRHQRYFSAQV